jgi:hypothetical protein
MERRRARDLLGAWTALIRIRNTRVKMVGTKDGVVVRCGGD